jgi:hypothetical protein
MSGKSKKALGKQRIPDDLKVREKQSNKKGG